jgi:hypothetical protein
MIQKVDTIFIISVHGHKHVVGVVGDKKRGYAAETLNNTKLSAHGKTKTQAVRNLTQTIDHTQNLSATHE